MDERPRARGPPSPRSRWLCYRGAELPAGRRRRRLGQRAVGEPVRDRRVRRGDGARAGRAATHGRVTAARGPRAASCGAPGPGPGPRAVLGPGTGPRARALARLRDARLRYERFCRL